LNDGGTANDVDNYPFVEPRGKFLLPRMLDYDNTITTKNIKIELIGHSTGG